MPLFPIPFFHASLTFPQDGRHAAERFYSLITEDGKFALLLVHAVM
jgi:hypothetical protein